jgi:hypothetical protein
MRVRPMAVLLAFAAAEAAVKAAAAPRCSPTMSGMSNLRKLALTQASAAAATIVETNTLLDPVARQCTDCIPTQTALASQRKALLPVGARAAVARARLWSAKRTLELAEGKLPKLRPFDSGVWRIARALLLSISLAYAAMIVAFAVAMFLPASPAVPSASLGNGFCLRLFLFNVEVAWS